jgi:hypothetical protein
MSTIVTRAGKGSALTHNEVDANFTNLNTDKLQSGDTAAALTITSATFGAGTVSAPSLTTSGDTNTGIFFPAADTIAFAEGGVESMRINSSGSIGIGTSSPQELLELSASNNGITAGAAPNNTLRFNDADISTASGQPIGRLEFYGNDTGNENVVAYIDARAGGTSGGGFFVFGTSASAGGAATDAFTMSVNGGISISRTDVTSPVSNDGNVFSGTYLPTLTNTTNIAASTRFDSQYMRVGNVVTVSGRLNIDPTTSGAACELGISLPIASNFSATTQCGGVGAIQTTTTEVSTGGIAADVTNDRAQFRFVAGGTAARDYHFTFTYQVI